MATGGSRGLSPLPVKEKAVSWTWCANAMGFSPCLSKKRPSHGPSARLRWAFPTACKGKGPYKARANAGPRCLQAVGDNAWCGMFLCPWEQCVPTCPPDSRHHHNLWSSRSASQECPWLVSTRSDPNWLGPTWTALANMVLRKAPKSKQIALTKNTPKVQLRLPSFRLGLLAGSPSWT